MMPRRSKRLRLLEDHRQSSPTSVVPKEHEETIINLDGFEFYKNIWLPDGVCFHIYSYISNGHITANRYANGVASLIHRTRLVSKYFLKSIERYLQSAPLKMLIRLGDDSPQIQRRIQWACDNSVNIEEFLFDVPILDADGLKRIKVFEQIVSCCQTSKLYKLGLILPFYNLRRLSPSSDGICTQVAATNFQRVLLTHISDVVCAPVKKMILKFHPCELHLSLVTKHSNSLEELEVRVCRFARDRPNELVLEDLSKAIQNMRQLKKLKISNFGKFGAASINIFSETLTEINVEDCDNGFYVNRCVCPSLKSFRCVHRVENNRQFQKKNGLKLENSDLFNYTRSFGCGMKDISMSFSACPTFGIRICDVESVQVPQTCTLHLKLF